MTDLEILKDIFNSNPELPNWKERKPPLRQAPSFEACWSAEPHYAIENNQVTGLSLGGFPITTAPKGVEKLKHLKCLVFLRNPIATIPTAIFDLPDLIWLGLDDLKLNEVPNEAFQMGKLERLTILGSKIVTLPAKIGDLINLKKLLLYGNLIISLPAEIGNLTKLETLDLRMNQLTSLPAEIAELKNLRNLQLGGNRFQIPEEIYEKSPQEQIRFILELQEQGAVPLNEGKVILLGDGSAGKTALVERLVEGTFSGNTEITEGIAITPWQRNGITFNIWDFGGQEIMRAMHQFFMTPRTLYLLVCTHRTDDGGTPVENWLRLIRTFSGDSPVIVVISKCDSHDLNLDENRLKDAYPNIQKFVHTDAKTAKGIEELGQAIDASLHCEQLKHVKDLIPRNQLKVKEALVENQQTKNYIHLSEYYQLCTSSQVIDNQEQLDLLRLLHDLGIAFNYGPKDNPSNTSVLKPEWVTKGIYAIINDNQLFQQEGRVRLSDLKGILKPAADYTGKHKVIMGLMEQFQLCFSQVEGEAWLVPDLLPKKQPSLKDKFDNSLQLQYQYEYLPRSIMPQFITRMSNIAEQYWQHGVIVSQDHNDGLVKVNYDKHNISIAVNGKPGTRRDLLDEIRAQLDVLNDRIKGTPPRMLVPLPDLPEVTVSYKLLLEHERAGDEKIRIEGVGERRVKPLLDGIVSKKERDRERIDGILDDFVRKNISEQLRLKGVLETDIQTLEEQLRLRQNMYQQMEQEASQYAKYWYSGYCVLIAFLVLTAVVVAIQNWSTFGEPLGWAVEKVIGLLLLIGIVVYSPKKFFEKKKASKLQQIIAYQQFDDKQYQGDVKKLERMKGQLEGL